MGALRIDDLCRQPPPNEMWASPYLSPQLPWGTNLAQGVRPRATGADRRQHLHTPLGMILLGSDVSARCSFLASPQSPVAASRRRRLSGPRGCQERERGWGRIEGRGLTFRAGIACLGVRGPLIKPITDSRADAATDCSSLFWGAVSAGLRRCRSRGTSTADTTGLRRSCVAWARTSPASDAGTGQQRGGGGDAQSGSHGQHEPRAIAAPGVAP
uniref:Uncharacterized protein n=1 Tax=Tetraselmis sp. GSL018 TaxID=582737 RepID=A0A061QMX5_9CHLO